MQAGADITIICDTTIGACTLGLADLPISGVIGDTIRINTAYPAASCICVPTDLTVCRLTNVILHEIGHTIGLGHNDEIAGSAFFTQIAGTPTGFDAGSIFNSGPSEGRGYCDLGCTFNENDILALQALYGCLPAVNVGVTLNDPNPRPWEIVSITSTPSGMANYEVWAIFEGIPTRFLVHRNCGSAPMTSNFRIQNDPLMNCKMTLLVSQCDTYTHSYDRVIHYQSNISVTPSISDQADPSYPPQLGEDIEIKTAANGKGLYTVRIKYELWGQVQHQHVATVDCTNSSGINESWVTLWTNPALNYKTAVIEVVHDGTIVGQYPFTLFPA